MKKSIKKFEVKGIRNLSSVKGGGNGIGMESDDAERAQIRLMKRMN